MRKLIFTFLIALFSFSLSFAQSDIVIDDFESGAVTFTDEVHVNPPAHFDVAVVDNPVKAGVNTSNKVWEWKRYDAEAENKSWAGFWAILKTDIPAGYSKIEVKYMRKNATSQLRMKVEGAVTKEFNPVTPASKTNEWETLVFDLVANGIKNIHVISLFPDYYEPVVPTSTCYIDEIKAIYDPSVVAPPSPTTVILFNNSNDNRFYDNSWSTKTAPSTLVQEHWEGPNKPDGDKLPIVTSPFKSSPNAVKLQWKSATSGSWMAMVASIGWKVIDLKNLTTLKMWVYSPVAIASSDLPKFFFESHTGNPNKTGKLPLGNYLKSGVAANSWTQVVIPLSDVWAADATFTAKEFIKGIFFEQNAADNVEHTLYLDEIIYDSTFNLFTDSANDRFHDQSWSTKTAPSTLVQEHWEAAGKPDGDKLPSVTSPVKTGNNAIKLQWKSATGGDWMALVASVGWQSFDLTKKKTMKIWINSPVALARTALPYFYFEAHGGAKTGKLLLGNFLFADLAANTWTEVNIPLSDVWASDPAFKSIGVIKGIFFAQSAADNVEHTLYMDDFTFADEIATPPVLETKILFDNSASDRFHDQSYTTKTAPSTLLQEHWEAADKPDGDKLPCVTSPVVSATNSLKLQWKSATGGSWMAMVASIGWKSFDVKYFDYLRFWINAPVGFEKINLPKFFLESHTGNPNKSGKLNLSDYITSDIPANTWMEVIIPLDDIWAADPTYTTMNAVKGIFFEQNKADNADHTLFMDDFTFVRTSELPPAPSELLLFDNSADNRFHDQSWSTKTAPSTLVQEHWEAANKPDGDKLPCVAAPAVSAPNALKMQYKSATGGSWMALVASVGWKSFDLTPMKTLTFWMNSPVALAKTALPKIYLESHSGNPNKTGKVSLSAYLPNGLAANVWTAVSVPLADLYAADAAFTAKDVVKGVFFEQDAADNVEHTIFLDYFKFVSWATSAPKELSDNSLKAYYSNGEIHVLNYEGAVRVFDTVGRKITEGTTLNGNLKVNLKTGIYIVNTDNGNTKIVLK